MSSSPPPQQKLITHVCMYVCNDVAGNDVAMRACMYELLSGTTPVIFAQHVERGQQDKTVTLLTGFRNYLHYHLKATKTYMHMRMRKRVAGLLQGE